MKQNIESYYKIESDREIFYQIWPCKNAKATLFLTHGLGEHSECYDQLAKDLNKQNFQVFAWDLRGHGRSSGQRGYVNNFKDHCNDFKKVLNFFTSLKKYNTSPIVLLAHSMGGTIALRSYVEQRPKAPVMLCLSSPALGIYIKPNPVKEKLAIIANKYLPRLALNNEINYEILSKDPEQILRYQKDTLRHSKVNSRTYMGMKESFDIIFRKKNKLNIPILFLASRNDQVVDSTQTQKLFDELENTNKNLQFYEESMHEIFNDLQRKQVIEDLTSFINNNLK